MITVNYIDTILMGGTIQSNNGTVKLQTLLQTGNSHFPHQFLSISVVDRLRTFIRSVKVKVYTT